LSNGSLVPYTYFVLGGGGPIRTVPDWHLGDTVLATSLFNRYGGFANVSKIVMAFYDQVLDSDIVGDYFIDVDMPALIDHQTKFISSLMGGPASYSDEALERIHANLTIAKPAFDEIVSLLRETLEDFEMEPADVDQVIENMRARERYIVNA